ncbi:acyl-CoA synthetase [bacterium]|nr:acyl-CoA synthetase [Rubripirellula sp.]MDB4338657.1 acyl-CoA synthetase [Rubripirellula sp.]MDC0279052.1 acyl-CoA synthetase [bacterium]
MNHLAIIQRAISHGDRIALRSQKGVHTYRELIAGSHNISAALLDSANDLNEERIGFLVPTGETYINALWGIWRAGGIAVPLSMSATAKELQYTLADSQIKRVLVADESSKHLSVACANLDVQLISIDRLPLPRDQNLPEIQSSRRAMILYTSGTTSRPKGVVTSHACIESQIQSLIEAWHWQSSDRIPLFLPLHHIHGIINVMSCALWSGAEIDPYPKFKIDSIIAKVASGNYTVFMAVPTIYVKLIEFLETLPPSEFASIAEGFGAMRLMVSGSAALPASVHEKWTELTGQKLLERYGMTEIGMALSNPYVGERRPGAVGQPLPGVQIRLADDAGNVLKETDKGPGEIQVCGPSVFKEYWNRPDATRDSFDHDWFRTGDIAVIESGYFRIMGRSSVDIIKSGGYKLSALEIEASLLDHPAISQCAVIGLPDETWGEIVAAAVVYSKNRTVDCETLQNWCKDRISSYKIPRRLLGIQELPRNAMGKITKPAVVKLFSN